MSASVVCFGEVLLRLGAPGRERLLQSPRLAVHIGGAEANVAVSLARFGHDAVMTGTISDNVLGRAAIGELRRHGVDTRRMRTTSDRMGIYYLTTGAGHRPSEVLYDRAHSAFALAPADAYDWSTLLSDARILHLSGITPALGRNTADAALAAARAARAVGALVSFDGNFRAKLWAQWSGDPQARLRGLMAEADIAFADHRDIVLMLGDPTGDAGDGDERFRRAAERAFAAFPNLQKIASTVRSQHSVDHHGFGALMATRDGALHRAPDHVLVGIVDRIGAGDAFAAGVLHGLLTDMADAAALNFGLAAACLKHSIKGDFNLVDVEDVVALVQGDRLDVKR